MIVCVCRNISEGDIMRKASEGLGFDDIQMDLGIALQCGQCAACARMVIAKAWVERERLDISCPQGSVSS